MPVKTQHPEYKAYVDKWERCEDVAAGQDRIHEAGQKYLPVLADQSPEEYNAYKTRTPFYNATWRTIVGLQGMLFRKPPQVEVPESVEPMLDNVTLDGTSLHIFALNLSEECLKIGRLGVFVDYPEVDVEAATKADALTMNYRPLLKMYRARSIINWKTRTIRNATVLSMVVLAEIANVAKDEYEDEEVEQFRVLDLVDIKDKDGAVRPTYRVRVIQVEMQEGKEVEIIKSTVFPMIDGKTLDYIPFQFIGVDDVSWSIDEPPLIDLVDMNLSHYRTAADYEHGCHFTGLPTPVISGYVPGSDENGKTEKFFIGSMTAWVFPRPDAKASFLEFKGEGLNALEKNLSKKENHMAILGARMLEVQRNGVESAQTAAIHRGGEQSMLSSVAQAISIGVTKVLRTFCEFAGADSSNVKFELNRDFFPVPMDSLQLTAIIAAWQNGAISYETMLENLKKGEIVKLELSAEDEQKRIKEYEPPTPQSKSSASASPSSPALSETGKTAEPSATQLQNTK